MPKLSKAEVAVGGLLTGLETLIKQWKPDDLFSETKYRDSLLAFLRKALPDDCRLEREYRHGGTTADLWIS